MLKIKNTKNIKTNIYIYSNIQYIEKKFSFYTNLIKTVDIAFQGKTYKWKIKKHVFKLTFNKAHKTWIFFKKNIFKILSKNKIRMHMYNNISQFNFKNFLLKIRKNNVFTQRGIKIKNSTIYKKRGKISTYK